MKKKKIYIQRKRLPQTYSSKPAIKMSSTIPKTFGILVNNLSIFLWRISSTGAILNGSLMYWNLPNGQEDVVRYDNFSSSFKLWFTFISIRCFMPASFGGVFFSVRPLWIGLNSALLSLAGSRHSLTLPFSLGTNMKLFHHSDILSIPSLTIAAKHMLPFSGVPDIVNCHI